MHVVLLGAWPAAFEALLRSGHQVSVLYENNENNQSRIAPYLNQFTYKCVVDSYMRVESLWSALYHSGAIGDGVDAVVPLFEAAIVPGATLGALVGAASLEPIVALRCRDKAVQKAAWDNARVPTARHLVTTDPNEDLTMLTQEAGMMPPFIVKPVDGRGAMETFRIPDVTSLTETVRDIQRRRPELARLLVEEEIQGTEWIIDGMVRDGEIRWILLSRYQSPVIDTTVQNPLRVSSFPPARYISWYKSATEFAQRSVNALGLRDSVFHLEAFGEPDHFVAGELAARTGGGMLPNMAHRALGIDVWECAVKAVIRERIEIPQAPSEKFFAFVGIPINPGRKNFIERADLATIPGVVEVDIDIRSGETMPDRLDNSTVWVGTALVEGRSETECHEILNRVIETAHMVNGK
jgi:hypothetical protein